MENKLKKLFDFQKFEMNSELSFLISDTHSRSARALSDNELDFIFAAGEIDTLLGDEKNNSI